VVTSVDPAGPAVAAGVRPGDRVVAIDGRTVADLSAVVASELLAPWRVAAGQRVRLDVARDGQPRVTIEITAARYVEPAPTND
jgi:regulator of sigma E protease